MTDFFQEYDIANLYTCINILINVDKCLDITVIVMRLIINFYVLFDI